MVFLLMSIIALLQPWHHQFLLCYFFNFQEVHILLTASDNRLDSLYMASLLFSKNQKPMQDCVSANLSCHTKIAHIAWLKQETLIFWQFWAPARLKVARTFWLSHSAFVYDLTQKKKLWCPSFLYKATNPINQGFIFVTLFKLCHLVMQVHWK